MYLASENWLKIHIYSEITHSECWKLTENTHACSDALRLHIFAQITHQGTVSWLPLSDLMATAVDQRTTHWVRLIHSDAWLLHVYWGYSCSYCKMGLICAASSHTWFYHMCNMYVSGPPRLRFLSSNRNRILKKRYMYLCGWGRDLRPGLLGILSCSR